MASWFSSDWHLGHTNVLKYDNRPFSNIEEHDKVIIRNYQDAVDENDNFYFLGDFAFKNKVGIEYYMQQLPGNKFFIKGNHDKKDTVKLYEKYGTFLGTLAELEIEGHRIVLCHYKMFSWNKSHHGNWHLYGHSHGSSEWYPIGKSFDVGANLWDYKPLSFEKVKEIMGTKQFKQIDRHGTI